MLPYIKYPHRLSGRPTTWRGFTLIELMIAIAIMAILAVISTNEYFVYIRNSKISLAQQYLIDLAATQEKFYMDNRRYTTTPSASGLGSLPFDLQGHYNSPVVVVSNSEPAQFYALMSPNTNSGIMGRRYRDNMPLVLGVDSEFNRFHVPANIATSCTCANASVCAFSPSTHMSWEVARNKTVINASERWGANVIGTRSITTQSSTTTCAE